jgi:hypothetical protein
MERLNRDLWAFAKIRGQKQKSFSLDTKTVKNTRVSFKIEKKVRQILAV